MSRARIALFALALLGAADAAAERFDEALYARVLARHTREVADLAGVRVDYAALGRVPEWPRVVASLASVAPAHLASREERLATWINAYNVLAIDLVVRHYPVDGIRDIGSLFSPVWKREAGRVAGRPVSLDEIEHEILRPMGDPRIHGAIVCASLSCPSLAREPFTAARIDAQLDAAMRRWLADPRKGLALDRARGTLRLSRIFDWFEEDFATSRGIVAFAARYAPEASRQWLEGEGARARIVYFDYDWSLNDLTTPDEFRMRNVP